MVPRVNKTTEAVAKELERLEGAKFLEPDLVHNLYRFVVYLVNEFDDLGLVYRGHSLREGRGLTLLVVKAVVEGEPHVCFINARTTAICIEIFLEMLDEDRIGWVPDKFA